MPLRIPLLIPFISRVKKIAAYILPALFLLSACRDFAVTPEGGSSSAPQPREFQVDIQDPFEMAPGDHVFIANTNLELSFSFVYNESRCPTNVNCVHPGSASILIDITQQGGSSSQMIVSIPGLVRTPYEFNDIVQVEGLRFKLLQLSPHPVNPGEVIPESEYRALLSVSPV